MGIGSANVRRSVAVGAVLAAAFILGFAAETASLYEFWPIVLVLGALVLLVPWRWSPSWTGTFGCLPRF